MISIFRTHQKVLMIIVTIIIIIAFAWFYNTTQFERRGAGALATVYDKPLTQMEVDRYERTLRVAYAAGMFGYLQSLGAFTMQGFNIENYVLNSLVTDHEAARLQLSATPPEIRDAIRKMPRFQTVGQFDSTKFAAFLQETLAPFGFTQGQFEQLVARQIAVAKLKDLVDATVFVTPAEFRREYERRFRKADVAFVQWDLGAAKAEVQPSEDDIARVYEARKTQFQNPEKRRVSYVEFALSDEADDLQGEMLARARQDLAAKAEAFTQAMLEPGAKFAEVAAKMALEVKDAGEFTADTHPDDFADEPEVRRALALLTAEQPSSDAVAVDDKFVVFHLDSVTEASQMSLEEATPSIADSIKTERATEKVRADVTAARGKIETALKEGKTFSEAAAAAGLTAIKVPALSISEPPPEGVAISPRVYPEIARLDPGELSGAVNTESGFALVFIEARHPVDEKDFESRKEALHGQMNEARRGMAFAEWLRIARSNANIKAQNRM